MFPFPALHPAERIATGYSWTECPRWHDGHFYFSDMYNRRVIRLNEDGRAETFLDLGGREGVDGAEVVVAGTGFLPDGRMLVNSMFEKLVLVYDGRNVEVHADLRGLAVGPINDMVVDAAGRAYVTQLGCDLWRGEPKRDSFIILVGPDGAARDLTEAGEIAGANGIALSADGRTLVTAAAFANQVLAFDVAEDGSLGNRSLFAEVDILPDGLCLDAEGGAWVAQPGGGGAVRVVDGGLVTDRVVVDPALAGRSTACGLGGPGRRTLFLCCGFEVYDFGKSRREGRGSIWAVRVPVGAGATRP
ncbi:sugar lactone lactonase YvrE [Thermocatellispora tengchongensis]|uniref:Sugar lactone lactonase YvrE n=1 Tax=Thermocatellispora tengchongensis TaxID=1073253 RepID=A0A840PG55_9ACTN|nr:SMP-30/gluconolactonase/LRE family protein [Thermocatellispora tengchongensis]MBB5136821.1 sugar lactone lactonase YvrE [Thermocatellispora tengchongensis]